MNSKINSEITSKVVYNRELWGATRRAQVLQEVRRIMREKKILSSDLAERLSVSEASVSRLLKGSHNPSLEKLYEIADALEVPLTITFGTSTTDALISQT